MHRRPPQGRPLQKQWGRAREEPERRPTEMRDEQNAFSVRIESSEEKNVRDNDRTRPSTAEESAGKPVWGASGASRPGKGQHERSAEAHGAIPRLAEELGVSPPALTKKRFGTRTQDPYRLALEGAAL